MADLLGLDVKAKVDAVPNDPPELNYKVWLKAVYNAVEEWVGIQASVQSVSANTTLTKDSARTTKMTTGPTNRTVTLPVGSTCREGQRFRIFKADSGTGNVSLARQSTDTIDGTTSPTLLYSQYNYVEVEWLGGGIWTITPGGLKSNGTSGGEVWYLYADGRQINELIFNAAVAGIYANAWGTTAGNHYYKDTTWTFSRAFVVAPHVVSGGENHRAAGSTTVTSVSAVIRVWRRSGVTTTGVAAIASGRWRT